MFTELKRVFRFFNSSFIARKANVASVSNAGNVSQNPNNSFSLVLSQKTASEQKCAAPTERLGIAYSLAIKLPNLRL